MSTEQDRGKQFLMDRDDGEWPKGPIDGLIFSEENIKAMKEEAREILRRYEKDQAERQPGPSLDRRTKHSERMSGKYPMSFWKE